MAPDIDLRSTLGELVTRHPDLARELERHALDYCCGGQDTLEDACRARGLDPVEVAADLAAAAGAPPAAWAGLDPAALADHLEATHHAYLHEELPRVAALMAKVRSVHGDNHPELHDVEASFTSLRADLDPHLAKEERVLFPLIRELAAGRSPVMPGGTIHNPVAALMGEHDHAGELLAELRDLTSDYEVPADGCASYQALYAALLEIERDTHLHVHIENNRLFPMAVQLEAAAVASVSAT